MAAHGEWGSAIELHLKHILIHEAALLAQPPDFSNAGTHTVCGFTEMSVDPDWVFHFLTFSTGIGNEAFSISCASETRLQVKKIRYSPTYTMPQVKKNSNMNSSKFF